MRYERRFGRYIYPSDIEAEMFKIDPNLKVIRDLKEAYIKFNDDYVGNPKDAKKGLENIIKMYRECKYRLFNDIADSLTNHFEEIINSFIIVEKYGDKAYIDCIWSIKLNKNNRKINKIKQECQKLYYFH